MNKYFSSNIGELVLVNVGRSTVLATPTGVLLGPYSDDFCSDIHAEIGFLVKSVSYRRVFEQDLIEIIPQSGRTGLDLVELVKALIRKYNQ